MLLPYSYPSTFLCLLNSILRYFSFPFMQFSCRPLSATKCTLSTTNISIKTDETNIEQQKEYKDLLILNSCNTLDIAA